MFDHYWYDENAKPYKPVLPDAAALDRLRNRLVISAPFGNYRFFDPGDAILTGGTFTLQKRAGFLKRIWRVVSTVRYDRKNKAWVNKLGLPNPGIDWLLEKVERTPERFRGRIISIKGFNNMEWQRLTYIMRLITKKAGLVGVELNVSCPNVADGHYQKPKFSGISDLLHVHCPVIVKLPPDDFMGLFEDAYESGIRVFHCCNTIPVPAGGMSGKPLKPLALAAVAQIRSNAPDAVIIGGGGINGMRDARDYMEAGADSVAMASGLISLVGGLRAAEVAAYMRGRREYAVKRRKAAAAL